MRRALAAIGLVLVFLLASVFGLLLHLDTPPARRIALSKVNALLSSTFRGSVRIEELSSTSLLRGEIAGASVTVHDPDGHEVLEVHGASAEVDLWALASSWRSSGPIRVHLPTASVAEAEFTVSDTDGRIGIARAFEPRSASGGGTGRSVTVRIDAVRIESTRVSLALSSAPKFDGRVSGLSGSFHYEPERLRATVDQAGIATRGLLRDLDPAGHVRGTFALDPRSARIDATALFQGAMGDVNVDAQGSYAAGSVRATVHVPPTRASKLRRALGAPLYQSVGMDARVSGTLPNLEGALLARIGDGQVRARVSGRVSSSPEGTVSFDASQVNPRAFSPDAPDAPVSAAGTVTARQQQNGEPSVSARVTTKSVMVDGTRVPPLGVLAHYNGRRVSGEVRANERGVRLDVDASFVPAAGETGAHRVDFDASGSVTDLSRLRKTAQGRVSGEASGSVTLPKSGPPKLSADLEASGAGIAFAGASAASASGSGHVEGALDALHASAQFTAHDVAFQGRRARRVHARVRGDRGRLRVSVETQGGTLPETDATFTLRLAPRVVVSDVSTILGGDGVRARIDAGTLTPAAGGVRAKGVRISGIGELSADGVFAPRGFDFEVRGEDVRLDRLGSLLGIQQLGSGRATFHAKLRDDDGLVNGTVKVSATGVDAFGVHDANVNLDAAVTDDRVDGSATITVGDIARVSVVTSKLTLPKHGALRLAELRGELLVSSSVDLSEAARLLPDPIGYDIDGRAFVDLRAKLGESNPRVRFELRTLNLEVTERVQGGEIETRQEALRRQPLAFHGLDLDLRGELTPEHSRLSGKVLDEHGPLLRLQLGGDVPLPALLRHPNEAARRLAEVRYEADVELPRRELSTWPARFRPPSLLGKVSGHGKLRGTLRDPSLSVRLQGEGLHSKANRRVSPATLRASLSYADGRGNAGVSLSHGDGEMSLTGDYSASWSALLAGRSPELRGDVRLTARNYALDRIPILSAREFRGRLSGTIVASGLGTDPRVEGRLQLRQLHVARVKLSSAEISMKAGDGDLHAEAHLAHPGGNLNATLDAGIRWQKELLPKLDDERVLSAQVKAKSFRAGTFLPLVSGSVAKLDGRIDADLSARIGPGERTLSGSAELSHGVVQVPAIGQELHAIHGKLRARKDGTLYLDDVSARGLVGRVRAAASARLRGFELVAFSANAKIDEGEKIPLTLQGVSLGNMWGRVHVDGRTTGSRDLDLKVDVASFHLEMPSLTPRSVQSLEPAEHVRVGVRHDDGTLTVLPLQPLEEENPDPTTLRVKVTLGNDVWLRQDTTARVKLDGAVTLDVAKAAAARGTIHLTQGRIDVSGKLFEIVNGTVTFDGDVSNPTVVATARWESPDGVVVFAEFSGPVKSGNLHLRSDPALGESQILALLLFGSTDGMIGAGSSSDGGKAATAASVGGGIATKGLNAAFRRLTDVDVTARIDTSDSQQPRPELAVQVTRRVTAKVGYNIGEPAPGKAPDRTQFTLDFRLSRRWSLATTFGDRGSSLLELLWRYRY